MQTFPKCISDMQLHLRLELRSLCPLPTTITIARVPQHYFSVSSFLCRPKMSEADVGNIAEDIEPFCQKSIIFSLCCGAHSVIVIVIGNRHSDPSSYSRQGSFAFYIALMLFRTIHLQLFSLQLCVDSRADWVLQPQYGNQSRRKSLNSNLLNFGKKNLPCVVSCLCREVG